MRVCNMDFGSLFISPVSMALGAILFVWLCFSAPYWLVFGFCRVPPAPLVYIYLVFDENDGVLGVGV